MRTQLVRSLVTAFALCSSAAPALATSASSPTPASSHGWRDVATSTLRPDGRAFISMAGETRALSTLRLRSATGAASLIRQLVVEFTDGSTLIRRGLAEELAGGRPVKFDLGDCPRQVKRVVVYGDAGAQLDVSAR